jgi:hypothetical protein
MPDDVCKVWLTKTDLNSKNRLYESIIIYITGKYNTWGWWVTITAFLIILVVEAV